MNTPLTANFSGSPLHIAIIGAGPGGLLSAFYLQHRLKVPYQATMFEMSDRVGGKILTKAFKEVPVTYEAGCKEIYSYPQMGFDPLRQMIADLGLILEPMSGEGVVMDDRMIANTEDLANMFGPEVLEKVQNFIASARQEISPESYADQMTVDNKLKDSDKKNGSEVLLEINESTARKYLQTAIHSDLAEEPHRTSAKYVLENWLTNEADYMKIGSIKGGNELFAVNLAARLSRRKCKLLLEHSVASVDKTESGFTVTANCHGEEVKQGFDFVMVCLPNNYLMDIHWQPSSFGESVLKHHQFYDRPAHYLVVAVLFEKQFWCDDAARFSVQDDMEEAIKNTRKQVKEKEENLTGLESLAMEFLCQ